MLVDDGFFRQGEGRDEEQVREQGEKRVRARAERVKRVARMRTRRHVHVMDPKLDTTCAIFSGTTYSCGFAWDTFFKPSTPRLSGRQASSH